MSPVIVFDLYGVIARDQTPAAKAEIERLAGVSADGVSGERFWEAYWACRPDYDAGQDSVAYWKTVETRLGTQLPDIPAVLEADLASWTEVDDAMVALVGELADQGRTLGLLSNIITDLVPRFEARHHAWLGRFDALTYSCRIGVAKPDPRAYEICAERLGVAPADIVFFDDKPSFVEGARAVGMTAEVFTSPDQVRAFLAQRA
ncbi:HAD family phosphatase [Actinomadura barringtoniae]|uniref:HAD family phosphatase n=1 Tax=Actinomadura barringtoniae TaxID=1427535 RepID=A0A939P741_9ACTN|nr:HAD family phosphatase [Actinomadura barringtoniae]MBO2446735.1 HAD family phosphatase [Actinomadura barringtoniae]